MASTRLVYSTDSGANCDSCGKPLRKCKCQETDSIINADGNIRLGLERKGRGGKQVTVIQGLLDSTGNPKSLVKELKSLCGSGGTVKGSILEIQGDHRETIKARLTEQGYRVKFSGG